MFEAEGRFFQALPEELMFASVERGYRRYLIRMKSFEEKGFIQDPKIDRHWIAVCLSHAEFEPLLKALENGGPELQPLLEELRQGQENEIIIDEVSQG